ncbi:MAG: isoleucine--tRNA ligase, partial [Selenomonadaceae bacterium]|nr:isoleucine--tRNA ligase [Selenomonadaceae bacterium]
AARNAANIKNRQPVADMFVKAEALPEFFVEIIEDELNVKRVEFRADMDDFISYNIKPNFRVLGKKVGKRMGEVKAALEKLDGQAAKLELDKTGELKLGDITLTAEDIEITITQSEGFNCQSDGDVSIALSTTLTPALIEEGFVREIISKVQVMRRESDFEVTDRIKIFASGNDKLAEIISRNAAEIQAVTLANEIIFSANAAAKDWDINGEKISLAVERT